MGDDDERSTLADDSSRSDPPTPPSGQIDVALYGEELAPGARTGDHLITGTIARGGCGTVYMAEHRLLRRKAAVKVLHRELAGNAISVKRFLREAMAVNKIRHPSIVDIFDFGELQDGRPFFVMEYLDGPTLSSVLRKEGRFSPERALLAMEPICTALSAVHVAGFVHRDIKASNIICVGGLGPVGTVKLVDFGIAKLLRPEPGEEGLTAAGTVLGTPYAMAPEQIRGLPVDARTDIYALGILLYNLLTGAVPFEGDTRIELERRHLTAAPPRPSQVAPVPAALDAVVLRCLEKPLTRRFESCAALLDALRQAMAAGPTVVAATTDRKAVAVYVEARTRPGAEMDDVGMDDMAAVVERTEEILQAAGYQLLVQSGNSVLGAALLPSDLASARAAVMEARVLADRIHKTLIERTARGARLHVNVCVTVDSALARKKGSREEIAGGAIAKMGGWIPKDDVEGVFVTEAAIKTGQDPPA